MRPKTSRGFRARHDVGTDSQSFHHLRAEALDQAVGGSNQIEQCGDAIWMLQVDGDVASAAQQHVVVRAVGGRAVDRIGALDADHLGAHVGQHHRCERARADPGQLDDAISGKRACHACHH